METQHEKNRGGRPKLAESQRRDYQILFYMNKTEIKQLDKRVSAAGLNVANFCRSVLLNQQITSIPAANKDAIFELNRIGNNLNQIAKRLNAGEQETAEIGGIIDELQNKIAEIGTKLAGGEQ